MNFAKFVRTSFSAEHHQTTTSDYSMSIILVIKGELASGALNYDTKIMYQIEPKCNLLRRTLQVKQQVSEAIVTWFFKIS